MTQTVRSLFPRLLLLALLNAFSLHAATNTGSFQVNATVVSSCNVSGALLNFGNNIDPLSASLPVDASSTLTVVCTNTTPYSVALDAGTNAGGGANFSNRAMKSGANVLNYQLYLNAGRTSIWGDGSSGTQTSTGTGTGSSQSLSIYGRLPSLTGTIPGTYTDTVTVTITY